MNKKQILTIIDDIILSAKSDTHKNNLIVVPEIEDFSKQELMDMEYDAIGYYIKDNPLDHYKTRLSQLCPIVTLKEKSPGDSVVVGGRIVELKKLITKKGDDMAFLTVEDYTGKTEVVIFPSIYNKDKQFLVANKIVEVYGKVEGSSYQVKGEEIYTNKLIAFRIRDIQEAKKITSLELDLKDTNNLENIIKVLADNRGDIPVKINYLDKFTFNTDYQIAHEGIEKLENNTEVKRIYEEIRR